MHSVALFACLVAAVSAHGMGGNGYGNMGYNNGMMTGGMMGQTMGGNNMMGGNMVMQNMLSQILQGMMMRNNMGNNMGGGRSDDSKESDDDDDDKQKEMMEKMFMMMFEKLMKGDEKKGDSDESDDDSKENDEQMKEMMAMKNWYDMTRMADKMMVYMEYKKNEAEFVEAMSHLCLLVNATVTYTMKNNATMYQKISDEEWKQLEEDAANWSDKEKAEYVMKLLKEDEERYGELFFRFAMWGCQSGEKYAASSMIMERMMRGEN